MTLQEGLALSAHVDDREEQVLGGDELVAEAAGFVRGALEHAASTGVEGQLTAGHLRPPGEERGQLPAERGQVHAHPAKGLGRDSLLILGERREEVLGIEHGALEPFREGLSAGDRLLGLLGESFEVHGEFVLRVVAPD